MSRNTYAAAQVTKPIRLGIIFLWVEAREGNERERVVRQLFAELTELFVSRRIATALCFVASRKRKPIGTLSQKQDLPPTGMQNPASDNHGEGRVQRT